MEQGRQTEGIKRLIQIDAVKISRDFGHRRVLKDISFSVKTGSCLAITGPNGSGKTTLMRILSHLIRPNSGQLSYERDGQRIEVQKIYPLIGFVGPYLELYQDLTAAENLHFFARMHGLSQPKDRIESLMSRVGLSGRLDDPVKAYSSGMQQRLKYASALLHDPQVLFVDEPRSNLDEQGIEIIYQILAEVKKKHLLVIATNDQQDLQFADVRVEVHA